MARVEQKHLEGLIFRTSEKKEVVKDGQKRNRYFPVERPLDVKDIIAERDDGNTFHIVTADGRKYDVSKTPQKSGGEGGKEDNGKKGK